MPEEWNNTPWIIDENAPIEEHKKDVFENVSTDDFENSVFTGQGIETPF